MYKLGDENVMVKKIQEFLNISITGIFNEDTRKAVMRFQLTEHLIADGIVGPETLSAMGILDTDLSISGKYKTDSKLTIFKAFMSPTEYFTEDLPILNDYVFLHHTAGWEDPYAQIRIWEKDSRGKIGTEFVVGGCNVRTGSKDKDGVVVQAFPQGSQAWHLGLTNSYYMNRHSVGIELCNFGWLTKEERTYTGVKAHPSQISELKFNFRGKTKFHRYSDDQLDSTRKLLLYIAERDNIDLRVGLVDWIKKRGVEEAFSFSPSACAGEVKGLLTHVNVKRDDKFDCHPQEELIDMLMTL